MRGAEVIELPVVLGTIFGRMRVHIHPTHRVFHKVSCPGGRSLASMHVLCHRRFPASLSWVRRVTLRALPT